MKYRLLQKGEIIQAGDEFDACVDAWRDNAVWVPAPQHMIGTPASDPAYVSHAVYRRPTPVAAELACAYDHARLALDGHSTCPECGAIPPIR